VTCNLEARGVRTRLRHALVNTGLLVATGLALLALGAPREARWVVAVPAFLSAIGFLQVATRTCVLFGARGVREDPTSIVRVSDDAERRALFVRSVGITVGAAAIGAAVAALVVRS
jgi:hypothetical protein